MSTNAPFPVGNGAWCGVSINVTTMVESLINDAPAVVVTVSEVTKPEITSKAAELGPQTSGSGHFQMERRTRGGHRS